MNKVSHYIQDRGAQLYLYTMGLVFTAVVAIQIVRNEPLSTAATGYIGLVVGYAINSHGVSQGVSSTNDTVAKTAIAQQPLTQASVASTNIQDERISALERVQPIVKDHTHG